MIEAFRITLPGTRHVLFILEDTEWTTFHVTEETDPEQIVAEVMEPHEFNRKEAFALFSRLHATN